MDKLLDFPQTLGEKYSRICEEALNFFPFSLIESSQMHNIQGSRLKRGDQLFFEQSRNVQSIVLLVRALTLYPQIHISLSLQLVNNITESAAEIFLEGKCSNRKH